MEFPDLSQEAGVHFLDDYLLSHSYISGFEASANDLLVLNALKGKEPDDSLKNARRWFRHVQFFAGKKLPESDEKIKIFSSDSCSKVEVKLSGLIWWFSL